MTEAVNGRAYDTGRLYEETLTKDDLASVSSEWIEDRRKRLREKYDAQNWMRYYHLRHRSKLR